MHLTSRVDALGETADALEPVGAVMPDLAVGDLHAGDPGTLEGHRESDLSDRCGGGGISAR